MGASAQIDQGTAAVDSAALSSHKLVNVVKLVLAVGEHLLKILLGNLQSVEALLLLEDARGLGVKRLPVSLSDDTSRSWNINIDTIMNAKTTYPSGIAIS